MCSLHWSLFLQETHTHKRSVNLWLSQLRELKVHCLLVCSNVFWLKATSYKEIVLHTVTQTTSLWPDLSPIKFYGLVLLLDCPWTGFFFSAWISISSSRLLKGTAMFDVKEVSGELSSPIFFRYGVICGEWEGTQTKQTQSGLKSSVLLKHCSLGLGREFQRDVSIYKENAF